MDIEQHWSEILNVLDKAKRSNRFFSIATVDANGNPHVTPIGHVFFRDDQSAYYFDAYSKAMPENFKANPRVCLMAVNSSPLYWIRSLFKGRFTSAPGVRLFGEVSPVRDATTDEKLMLTQAIRSTRFFKGHKMLWGDLDRVRDINFDGFSPASYPKMCENLWK